MADGWIRYFDGWRHEDPHIHLRPLDGQWCAIGLGRFVLGGSPPATLARLASQLRDAGADAAAARVEALPRPPDAEPAREPWMEWEAAGGWRAGTQGHEFVVQIGRRHDRWHAMWRYRGPLRMAEAEGRTFSHALAVLEVMIGQCGELEAQDALVLLRQLRRYPPPAESGSD